LIDGGLPCDDLAVDRDQFTGADDNRFADQDLLDGICTSSPSRSRRAVLGANARRSVIARRALGREALDIISDAHEKDDDHRGGPFSDCQCGNHARLISVWAMIAC
jgi:hypothetical protein